MTLLMITLIIIMWSIFDISFVFLHIHFFLVLKISLFGACGSIASLKEF